MHYMLFTANNDTLRPLRQHNSATSKMQDACYALFKNTFDEMASKLESYVTCGIDGKHRP